MKKLLRRNGVPFLLTLTMLSVASGGFLCYEILGVPGVGGAAAALETPDLPPPLDGLPTFTPPPPPMKTRQAVTPARKKNDPEEEEVQEEPNRPTEGEASSEGKPSDAPSTGSAEPSPAGQNDQASARPSQEQPSVSSSKAASQASAKAATAQGGITSEGPVVVPPPPVQPRLAPSVVASTSPDVAPKPPKAPKPAPSGASPASAQKSSVPISIPAPVPPTKAQKEAAGVVGRQKPRRALVEYVPSEIPPEWNWFQKPLRIALTDGRVQIQVVDHDLARSSEETPRVAVSETMAPSQEKGESREVHPVAEPSMAGSPEAGKGEDGEKPFARALQKMVRTKARRKAEAERFQVVLPSYGGAPDKVPGALQKLQKALMEMTTSVRDASTNAEMAPDSPSETIRMVVEHEETSSSGSDVSEPEVAKMALPDSMGPPASGESRFGAGLDEVLRLQGWNRP